MADEYAAQVKASWGQTSEYLEFEEKTQSRSKVEETALGQQMMAIFAEIGEHKDGDPESETVQALVAKLQNYITKHYYTCSKQILSSLGQMFAAGGDMTANIDKAVGKGTAAFANEAIKVFCAK
ncbi:MAG: TipAS antibiotic-recognition domain-containing protein [Clostridia bacterium]|nr:TipAS antibiotic-recognition domain-containing protein [Clostridia bacterium]